MRILVREHLQGQFPEPSEHVRYTWLTPAPRRPALRVLLLSCVISLLVVLTVLPAHN